MQRASTSGPAASSCTRSSSRRTPRTVRRGFSEEYGSWKTSWIARLAARERCVSGEPSNSISPLSGATSPAIARATVVFPDPDSPTSPTASPACRRSETPSTARIRPRRADAKETVRSRALSIGTAGSAGGLTALGPGRSAGRRPRGPARRGTRSSTVPCRQASSANAQRGLNGQPGGSRAGSGSSPGIERGGAPGVVDVDDRLAQAERVGMARMVEQRRRSGRSRRSGRRT